MLVLKPFEYFEPKTVEEAVQVLSMYGEKAKVLAGGVDLVPSMRRREIQPQYVVSIQRIPGLHYIESDGTGSRIGALTTLRSIELSRAIQRGYLVLYEAVHQIASIQVKTMGTAVGNLCVATPASDVATALISLGAELKLAGPSKERIIPLESFFIGVNQAILQPDEIVTEILLPSLPAGTGGAFLKLVRTAGDIAKVNVAVVITITDNRCKEAKITLGSMAPTPIRTRKAEAAAGEAKPITDIRSTAEYRKETTKVLVRRAIEKALERVKE